MTDINNFIDALDTNKTIEANNIFAMAMQAKITSALDARKLEISNQVFNGAVEDSQQDK